MITERTTTAMPLLSKSTTSDDNKLHSKKSRSFDKSISFNKALYDKNE